MNQNTLISTLYSKLRKRQDVNALIPMGYVPNLPLLTVRAEQLIVQFPFLRYKVTGVVEHTMVFPIRYVIEYTLPECNVVKFTDLSTENSFVNTDFDKAVGFFRHDAVKSLDKEAYRQLREDTLALYDKLCLSLIDDGNYTPEDDAELKNNLQTLIEPSVKGFYKAIDADFYDKYIKE